jgi:hypothetical protein
MNAIAKMAIIELRMRWRDIAKRSLLVNRESSIFEPGATLSSMTSPQLLQ